MKDCIKCKDCKYLQRWRTPEQAAQFGQIYECEKEILSCPEPDDYCSKAERKEEQNQKFGKWIPVSEGLPEDKTYVLTTIKVPNRVAHARSGWYEEGFFHNDNGDTWRATDMEVIAWMYLPEPYKAESEDKE